MAVIEFDDVSKRFGDGILAVDSLNLRIADYAKRQGRRCVLHAWSTGIIKAATLHVLAAMEEAEYMEYCVQTTDLNQRLVKQRFPLVDGEVAIPDAPGLGVELD